MPLDGPAAKQPIAGSSWDIIELRRQVELLRLEMAELRAEVTKLKRTVFS